MRRVLIVSPHFPPVNAADMQRVRLALPWLKNGGWEATVLAVSPESIEGAVIEPLLEKTYPNDIRIVRVKGIPPKLTRPFHIGSLWLRCGIALRRAGDRLLKEEKFDLVFFSTTTFDSFSLGPRWLKKFSTPYVLDYQDPWLNDYYKRAQAAPPGGAFKYKITQWQAHRKEPNAVRNAAAIISVSGSYGPELCKRYPGLSTDLFHHLPFGTSEVDFDIARTHSPSAPLIPKADGNFHFVYTGRAGPDMKRSLSLLFKAFYLYKKHMPRAAERLRFHFIGTDYAPPPLGCERVMPIARTEGVAEHVTEHCYRIPYFDALHYLRTADALVAIGSDDPTYSASKIFPYLLVQRPLLAIAHSKSLMLQLLKDQGYPHGYGFLQNNENNDNSRVVEEVYSKWFKKEGYKQPPPSYKFSFAAYGAEAMAKQLVGVFNRAIKPPPFNSVK